MVPPPGTMVATPCIEARWLDPEASCGPSSTAASPPAAPHQVFPDLSDEERRQLQPAWLLRADGHAIMSPHIPPAMQRSCWHISQFVLREQLYRSARSKVFDATDRHSGMRVAIKMYRKHQMGAMNRLQAEREVNIQMSVDQHPNIIKLYAAFSDDKNVFLVQEFADGGDLFSKVQVRGSRLSEHKVQATVLTVLDVLDHLHAQEVIHRDIKPENILITSAGVIKVTDFGLSIDLKEERPVTRLGTLEYMAPEVLRNPDKTRPMENKDNDALVYTKQVDIWAVGVLTYELLVGRAPFEMDSYEGTYHSILHHDPVLPLWLSKTAKSFIRAALCKIAVKRPGILQLLNHPWLSTPHTDGSDCSTETAAPDVQQQQQQQQQQLQQQLQQQQQKWQQPQQQQQQQQEAGGWLGQEPGKSSIKPAAPKAAETADRGPCSSAVAPLPALLYRSSTLDLRSDGPSLLQFLDEEEDLAHRQRQAQRAASPPPAAAAATTLRSAFCPVLTQPIWLTGRQEPPQPRSLAAVTPPPRRSRVLSDQGQSDPPPASLSPLLLEASGHMLAWHQGPDELAEQHLKHLAAVRPSNNRIKALDFAPRPEPLAEPRPSPRGGRGFGVSPRSPEFGARRDVIPELSPVKQSSQCPDRPQLVRAMFSSSCRALDCTGAGAGGRYGVSPEPSPTGHAPGPPPPVARPLVKTISSGSIGLGGKVLELGRRRDPVPQSPPATSGGNPSLEPLAMFSPSPQLEAGHSTAPRLDSLNLRASVYEIQVPRYGVSPSFGLASQTWGRR